jgi:small redox-active disulfide protein 2
MKNKPLKIQVLGSGCPTCKKLFELTSRAVKELGIETEVEYITAIEKIIELGVMQAPVLAINNKPVLVGTLPDLQTIKDLIENNQRPEVKGNCGCVCGGNC